MFSMAFCFLVAAIGTYFKLIALVWVGFGLFLPVVIIGLIYINTSKRLKRK